MHLQVRACRVQARYRSQQVGAIEAIVPPSVNSATFMDTIVSAVGVCLPGAGPAACGGDTSGGVRMVLAV